MSISKRGLGMTAFPTVSRGPRVTIRDEDGHSDLSLFERYEDAPPPRRNRRSSRPEVQIRRSRRRRLRGRIVPFIAVLIIAAVVITGFTIVRHVVNGFAVKDYKGSGTGTVLVNIPAGSSGSDIAAIMVKDDVVASSKAFLNATTSKEAEAFPSGYFQMRRADVGQERGRAVPDPVFAHRLLGDDHRGHDREADPAATGGQTAHLAGLVEGRGEHETTRHADRFRALQEQP